MTRTTTMFTFLAALAAAATAVAQPSLNFVDNGPGSVTLQVVTDANGSVATEIAAVDGGLLGSGDITFTNAFIADPATFDTPNPGNNPITGTVTTGLDLSNIATNEIFASFGSGILGVGAFDFLTVEFTGTGTIDAFGIIAQQGVNHDVITSIDVVPEPASALLLASITFCYGAIRFRRRC